MTATDADTGEAIATVVQWSSHPETTLGFEPPRADIAAGCAAKGWTGDDCTAEGRYFTADYPGVLRDIVQSEIGGEVLYFNGAIGSQIGPGEAPTSGVVDDEHPVGNGWTVPDGAQPVTGAADVSDENFATTEAIGRQLALHVIELAGETEPLEVDDRAGAEQAFYTRLTNIGFRLLLADGDLGWQVPDALHVLGCRSPTTRA